LRTRRQFKSKERARSIGGRQKPEGQKARTGETSREEKQSDHDRRETMPHGPVHGTGVSRHDTPVRLFLVLMRLEEIRREHQA
jgi:hypothetical protein